jgi:hypothetical protein
MLINIRIESILKINKSRFGSIQRGLTLTFLACLSTVLVLFGFKYYYYYYCLVSIGSVCLIDYNLEDMNHLTLYKNKIIMFKNIL